MCIVYGAIDHPVYLVSEEQCRVSADFWSNPIRLLLSAKTDDYFKFLTSRER